MRDQKDLMDMKVGQRDLTNGKIGQKDLMNVRIDQNDPTNEKIDQKSPGSIQRVEVDHLRKDPTIAQARRSHQDHRVIKNFHL